MNSNRYSIACFLIGSIFGLIGALWDAAWDGSMLGDDDSPLSVPEALAYNAIIIFAPFFYLLEAFFDISNTEHIRADSILFGIGAICELLAAVLAQIGLAPGGLLSRITTMISTHAYVLNVIILLVMDHRQRGLIFCGNVIFGIGASIDVILSYGFSWNPLWLDYGNLVSAFCWFIDALVYIAAQKVHDDDDDSSTDSSVDHEDGLEAPLLPFSLDTLEQASENSAGSSIRHRNIGPQPTVLGGVLRTSPHVL